MNYVVTLFLWGCVWIWSLHAQVIGSVEYGAPVCENLPDISISYSYCEDFEDMSLGDISPQGNPEWTLFGGPSGYQAFVVSPPPVGQGQALMFDADSDVDLNLDRMIQSNARLAWRMFFPTGKAGAWGLETTSSLYALSVYYEEEIASIYSSGSKLGEVAYPSDQWLTNALVFQPDEDQIEFWMDGQLVWILEDFQSNLLTDLNFFWANPGGGSQFYVDDVRYYEVAEDCGEDPFGGPVCVNDVLYSGASEALCDGYTDMEWTEGDCLTEIEEIDQPSMVRVFPNPVGKMTSGVVVIEALDAPGRLVIYSAQGEVKYMTEWGQEGTGRPSSQGVDVSAWVPGVYGICLSTRHDHFMQQLVVVGN